MKIAVTGANGFVGRQVLDQLRSEGHDAIPLVRRPSGLANEVVVGDLGDGAPSPSTFEDVAVVIHLAARTHVTREESLDPMAAYRHGNVAATAHVLDAALAAGVPRFVYVSSIKASGEWTSPGEPFTPSTPPRPEDAYGETKLEAEALVRERCSSAGAEWVILRPPLVYGAGVKGNFDLLIRAAANGIPLPFGGLNNRRSIISVANLADAITRAATRQPAANQLLLISDATLSTSELVQALAQALGRRARLVPVPRSAALLLGRLTGRQAQVARLWGSLEIDSSDAAAVLDWNPKVAFETALGETVAAWRTPRDNDR